MKEMVDVDSAKFLNNLTNTSTSDSQNFYSSQRISIEHIRLVLQRACITWNSNLIGVSIAE